MAIIDQFSDTSFVTLYRIIRDKPEVQEMLKEAEIHEDELKSLPDSAFAWTEKRAFPIHTKEHALMSLIYRENTSDPVPLYVDERLKVAQEIYEIPETAVVREKKAAVVDSDDDYLLPHLKKMRVKSAEDVKAAEHALLRDYQKLTVESRAMACGRLLEKAAEFNIQLSEPIHKLAGFTVSSTQTMRDWIGARKEATKVAAFKNAYGQLEQGLLNAPAEIKDRNVLVKIAGTLSDLDKQAGLTHLYNKTLLDPVQTVFNTDKVASQTIDLNGQLVPMSRLAAYGPEFFADVLGDDVVREASDAGGLNIEKLAMIIETLPRDMKTMLARYIR